MILLTHAILPISKPDISEQSGHCPLLKTPLGPPQKGCNRPAARRRAGGIELPSLQTQGKVSCPLQRMSHQLQADHTRFTMLAASTELHAVSMYCGRRRWPSRQVAAKSAKKTPVLKDSGAPFVGQLASLEAFVKAVASKCNFTATQMEQKAAEVANVKQGPLLAVRNRLLEVKSKLNTENAGMDALRKKVADAKASAEKDREAEVQELREVQCKAFAEDSVRRGCEAVEAAEALVEKATAAQQSASSLSGKGLKELEALKKDADVALQALGESKEVVAKLLEAHDTYRGQSRNLLLQARVELTKLKSRAGAAEKRCNHATEALRIAHAQVTKTTLFRAKNSLRTAFRKQGLARDTAFDSAAKGADQLALPDFEAYVAGLPTEDLTQEQVALLFRQFGGGSMDRPSFFKVVQEYATCIQEVAMTEGFAISSSSTVRKIQTSELVEVLEGPDEDEETKVRRVRCRALKDAKMGWVTIKGNQGTAFLKPREKPFLVASGPTDLREAPDAESRVLRGLEPGEKLELLEGPREVAPEAKLFLRGAACKDGTQGFLCLQELADSPAPSDKYYVCKAVIAMTQGFDITNCKPIRKVSVGEALEVLEESEESIEVSESSIARRRFRAVQDGREGWVTLKGNQGTVYLEKSSSHYLVERPLGLYSSAKSDAQTVRQLEVGEVFQAKGPPVKVTPEKCVLMRARALQDWAEGWISFVAGPSAPIKPFSSKPPAGQ
ncbi:Man1a1 [Symbiodinium natans]|uniref:Man1a1 protein n=1 Tax=Symbiodinium natans TaxID=878477 RepID=A0A812GW50_9DINO|nr:Man1a1 [Symbiodinium natans]